jgi:hypothetical protein
LPRHALPLLRQADDLRLEPLPGLRNRSRVEVVSSHPAVSPSEGAIFEPIVQWLWALALAEALAYLAAIQAAAQRTRCGS